MNIRSGCRIALLVPMMFIGTSATLAWAQSSGSNLHVGVSGVSDGALIPSNYASCMPDDRGRTKDSDNVSPAISWAHGPSGTQSYAVIMVDKDVPANMNMSNQPDQTIPDDAPRRDFYHWVLVNIPAKVRRLSQANTEYGLAGNNGFGGSDGYKGPCPPWNDARVHHYEYEVFALDVPALTLPKTFGGIEAEAAMTGHILAQGKVTATYTTNQALLSNLKSPM